MESFPTPADSRRGSEQRFAESNPPRDTPRDLHGCKPREMLPFSLAMCLRLKTARQPGKVAEIPETSSKLGANPAMSCAHPFVQRPAAAIPSVFPHKSDPLLPWIGGTSSSSLEFFFGHLC